MSYEIKELVSAFREMTLVDQLLFVAAIHANSTEERTAILDTMSQSALRIIVCVLGRLEEAQSVLWFCERGLETVH